MRRLMPVVPGYSEAVQAQCPGGVEEDRSESRSEGAAPWSRAGSCACDDDARAAVVVPQTASARVPAESAAAMRLAKFELTRLGTTPKSVRAGGRFRVKGRVRNVRGRRAGT